MKKNLLFLPLIALLAACNQQGTSYKEVTKDEFNTKQEDAQSALIDLNVDGIPYFNYVVLTGTVKAIDNVTKDEKVVQINAHYTYSVEEEDWTNDITDSTVEATASSYFYYVAGQEVYVLDNTTFTENNVKFYIGDDGSFRIDGSYKGVTDMIGIKMDSDCQSMTHIYNKYALVTSIKSTSTEKVELSTFKTDQTTIVDIKAEYSHK